MPGLRHEVEQANLPEKRLSPRRACDGRMKSHVPAVRDGRAGIIPKLVAADVIVLVSPVCFKLLVDVAKEFEK